MFDQRACDFYGIEEREPWHMGGRAPERTPLGSQIIAQYFFTGYIDTRIIDSDTVQYLSCMQDANQID